MAEVKTVKAEPFSGEETIKMVKNLLRYDIPFLLLGKSSIGKSYSITELAKEFRVPHSFLFIGSEKPSNIEGLPRLVGEKADTGDILEFFKPNWFPNAPLIQKYVTNGKKIFDQKIVGAYTGEKNSLQSGKDFRALHNLLETLSKLKWETPVTTSQSFELIDKSYATSTSTGRKLTSKPVKFEREIEKEKKLTDPNAMVKDEIRDLNLYLSTILGYGNFWLVLDELDKVDEREKDKYAPLLHIVRERNIKEYSFRTLNDGKGAMVPSKVRSGSNYKDIKARVDDSIKDELPLLDGRVIGIANATADIEDALFRRFLHIVVEDVMMINKPEPKLAEMRACFDKINDMSEKEFGQSGLMGGLEMKYIPEINLQWQYGFFPKILNKEDSLGNYFYRNLLEQFQKLSKEASKNPSKYKSQLINVSRLSALFKIVRNNFAVVSQDGQEMSPKDSMLLREEIMSCVTQQIGVNLGVEEDVAPEIATAGVTEESKTDLLREGILDVINRYYTMNPGDSTKVAEMIGALIDTQFPEDELPTAVSVSNWVDSSLAYIKVTMFNDENVFSQMDINKYLTPVVLRTIYDKVLGAKLDENAKKMAISKVSLMFGKLFLEQDIKTDAVSFDPELTQKEAEKMVSQVIPKLELSYMSTDIWQFLKFMTATESRRNELKGKYKQLYDRLKNKWGVQIVKEADRNVKALELQMKKLPESRHANIKKKIDKALQIKVMFK